MSQHNIQSTTITSSLRPLVLLSLLFLLLLPFPSYQTQTDKHYRSKRQTFDFSMNTPAPTETDVSNSSGAPDLPGSDGSSLGGGGGGSLGGLLGGLLGSSGSGTNSNPQTSSCPLPCVNGECRFTNEDGSGMYCDCTGGYTGDFCDTPCSHDCNDDDTLPSTTPVPATDESGLNSGGLLGGLLSSSGSGTNSSEDEEASSNGGSSGGLDSSNDCGDFGAFQCLFHTCHNGGECVNLNDSDCTPKCRCPAPFNDLELYDEQCGSRKGSDSSTSDPKTTPFCPLPCVNGQCRFTDEDGTGLYCDCTEGFVGDFCETPCSRSCSNEGVCHLDTTQGREVCVCPSPWVGAYCTELPPDDTPDTAWVYWLVGSLAVGLALVIIVAALIVYCLWKKRLVFAMKIVYYFKSYEDNDGLLYDAFVSYVSRPKDEDFVHKHLRPKLEQEMGFKLCLHQRDFIIGESITNNICGTLEDSRRFILVLTPQYLESEWAEFEYQKAFHEMLKLKMRIVPIILEEITSTSTINPTLKAILESVTYITYPGCEATQQQLDKFWKRVHLSMPKIKSKEATEFETPKHCADGEKPVGSHVAENGKVCGTLAYVKYCPNDGSPIGDSLAENGEVCSIDEGIELKETDTLKSTDEEIIAEDRHAESTKVFGADEGKELNVTLKSADGESLKAHAAVNGDESTDPNTLKGSAVVENGEALERNNGDLISEEPAPESTDPSRARVELLSPASLTDSGVGSTTEEDSLGFAENDTSDTSSVAEDDPITSKDSLTPVPSEIEVTRL